MNWGGFEKYLLVGYDFSWKPEGNYYAWENPKPKRFYMTHRTALDSKGDIVLTSENLIFSSRWLESYCQAFSLPVVNCTGGGILNVKPGDLEKELLRVNGNYRQIAEFVQQTYQTALRAGEAFNQAQLNLRLAREALWQ